MYSAADFFDDMARFTQYRCHPELVEYVIQNSLDSLVWLRGTRFNAGAGLRMALDVGASACGQL